MSIIIPVASDMVVVGSRRQPSWPAVPFCGLVLSWVPVLEDEEIGLTPSQMRPPRHKFLVWLVPPKSAEIATN